MTGTARRLLESDVYAVGTIKQAPEMKARKVVVGVASDQCRESRHGSGVVRL